MNELQLWIIIWTLTDIMFILLIHIVDLYAKIREVVTQTGLAGERGENPGCGSPENGPAKAEKNVNTAEMPTEFGV